MMQKIRIVGEIAVVMASADFNPLRKLVNLAKELETLRFSGHVLFDLLAINGFADNRFVSIDFDGKSFNRSSIAIESNIGQELRFEQDSLAKSDPVFLAGSILSSDEVNNFLH